MSDYLWDKRGEPDAEVARLEALLGAFRHEPQPLNLPAAVPEPTSARLLAFRPRRFAPVALAAAAALVVASVLIASLFLRAQSPAPPAAVVAMLNFPPDVLRAKGETPVPDYDVKVEKVRAGSLPRAGLRRKEAQVAVASRRQRLPAVEPETGGALTLERMSTPDGAATLVENARLLTKEQLVYALRFTGAKLKDVRERAQGATQK